LFKFGGEITGSGDKRPKANQGKNKKKYFLNLQPATFNTPSFR